MLPAHHQSVGAPPSHHATQGSLVPPVQANQRTDLAGLEHILYQEVADANAQAQAKGSVPTEIRAPPPSLARADHSLALAPAPSSLETTARRQDPIRPATGTVGAPRAAGDGWLALVVEREPPRCGGGWARRARRALSQLHALQCGPRDEQGFSSQ